MLRKLQLLFLFLIPLAATEEETPEPTIPQQEMMQQVDYKAQFQKLLISILVIIILILIVVYFIKFFSTKQSLQLNKKKFIKLIEKRPLSGQTILYLVEIGDRKLLFSESKLDVQKLESMNFKPHEDL